MKKYLLSLILTAVSLCAFSQTSNLPSSLGTFTVFKEAPLPVTIIMPSGYNVLNPKVELWNNNLKISDTTTVTISGDTLKFTLTKQQIVPLIRNPYFFLKFNETYILGAQLNPTIGVGTPVSQTKTITLPSNAVVRVSIVGSASEAEQSAVKAKAYADSAAAFASGIQTAIPGTVPGPEVKIYTVSQAGTYTNFSNLVVSSGDLTSGLVQLRKVGSTWSKVIVPIALGNYATLDEIYYPKSGQSTYGRNALSGATSLSVDRTRIENTAVAISGKLNTLRVVVMTAGTGKVKFVSKNVDGTYNFEKEFSFTFTTGENIITTSTFGTNFTVTAGWHIAFYGGTAQFASSNTGAVSGDTYSYVGDLLGANQTVTAVTTKLNFTSLIDYTITRNESLKSRVSDSTFNYGRSSISLQTTQSVLGTRIEPTTFAAAGYLQFVEAYFNTAGIGKLKVLTKNGDGTYSFVSEATITAVAGYNKFTPSDFGIVTVSTGQVLAWKGTYGEISAQTSAGGGSMYTYLGDLTGNNIAVTATSNQLQIKATISQQLPVLRSAVTGLKTANDAVATRVTYLEQNPADATYRLGTKIISSTKFPSTTTPTGWVLGNWTVNNGLRSPATGGLTSLAQYDSFTAITSKITRAYFTLNTLNPVFAISFYPFLTTFDSGTLAIIDVPGNRLRIVNWDALSVPSTGRTLTIPFTLVTGRKYLVEVFRIRLRTIFRITDPLTQVTATIDADETDGSTPRVGRQWGKAGVLFMSGSGSANDVTINEFQSMANSRAQIFATIMTDSNGEAFSLSVDYAKAFTYSLQDTRKNNDVVIVSRAGDNSAGAVARADIDLTFLAPKYAVLPIGTNDTSASTWIANMTILLQKAIAAGSKPVLATIMPRGDTNTYDAKNATVNAAIRSGTIGGYSFEYIDFAKAVSLNHDGVTVDPTLFNSDLLHINVLGHAAVIKQMKIDAPYLFEDAN